MAFSTKGRFDESAHTGRASSRRRSAVRGCNPIPANIKIWRSLLAAAPPSLYNSISGGKGIMSKGVRVIGPDRAQLRWEMVDLDSQLPDDHRARVVWAFVQGMELGELYDRRSDGGLAPG